MSTNHDNDGAIDERWLSEWVEFGMRELADYLGKHRRFDEYCASRSRRQTAA